MDVFAILDAVFGTWQGQGTLAPRWRFDVADQAIYPCRSLTTQYDESAANDYLHQRGLLKIYNEKIQSFMPKEGQK